MPNKFFQELVAEQLTDDGNWIATGDNHVLDAMVINAFLAHKNKYRKILPQSTRETKVKAVESRRLADSPSKPTVEAKPVKKRVQQGGEWWDD